MEHEITVEQASALETGLDLSSFQACLESAQNRADVSVKMLAPYNIFIGDCLLAESIEEAEIVVVTYTSASYSLEINWYLGEEEHIDKLWIFKDDTFFTHQD